MAANYVSISAITRALSGGSRLLSSHSHGGANLLNSCASFIQFHGISLGRRRGQQHHGSLQSIQCRLDFLDTSTTASSLSVPLSTLQKIADRVQTQTELICSDSFGGEHLRALVLADLEPATAQTAIAFVGPFLSAFGFLFILRIVMSWYPKLPVGDFPYVIAYAPTEPFLRQTRKVIPPLGGVDVTPVVWFGLVSFLNEILVGPQGLLVLLSQKV